MLKTLSPRAWEHFLFFNPSVCIHVLFRSFPLAPRAFVRANSLPQHLQPLFPSPRHQAGVGFKRGFVMLARPFPPMITIGGCKPHFPSEVTQGWPCSRWSGRPTCCSGSGWTESSTWRCSALSQAPGSNASVLVMCAGALLEPGSPFRGVSANNHNRLLFPSPLDPRSPAICSLHGFFLPPYTIPPPYFSALNSITQHYPPLAPGSKPNHTVFFSRNPIHNP